MDRGLDRSNPVPAGPGPNNLHPYTQTSGENSVGHQMAQRFVTIEQLGEAPKQVQEAVIKGVCEQMKVPNSQPRAEVGSTIGGSARRTGGAG